MIPLCHFRSFFKVFAHCSPLQLSDLVPDFLPTRAVIQSVLLRAFLSVTSSTRLSSDKPMSYNLFSIQSPSTPASSSHFGACLSKLRWSAFEAQLWLAPATLFPSTLHMLCCPFLPVDHFCSLQEHLFRALRGHHSHIHRHLPVKQKSVPLWPLDAQITGPAPNSDCKSSDFFSCLNFENLLSPRFHLLCWLFFQCTCAQACVAIVKSSS